MPATTNVNDRTVVHASSSGIATGFPDVCKTPAPPAPPIPIPYPNIAQSSDTAKGSSTVKIDGNPIMLEGSNFSTSTGDEAGSIGGVASNTTKGKAEFVNYSFDVKVEGKSVCRLGDMMLQNKASSPNGVLSRNGRSNCVMGIGSSPNNPARLCAPAGCAPIDIFRAALGIGPRLGEPGRPGYQMLLATAMSNATFRLRGWLDSLSGGSLLRSRLFLHRRGLLSRFLVMVTCPT